MLSKSATFASICTILDSLKSREGQQILGVDIRPFV